LLTDAAEQHHELMGTTSYWSGRALPIDMIQSLEPHSIARNS